MNSSFDELIRNLNPSVIVSRGASDSFGVNYRVDTTAALSFLHDVIESVEAGDL